ncbi:MAG TPA: hypothetical protein VF171_06865, partial [Trueperaceae bacterium]
GAGGERLLVYRDNLTAYKAASLTDGRVRRGCLVAQGDGGVPFEDGRRLLVEPLAPDGLLRA